MSSSSPSKADLHSRISAPSPWALVDSMGGTRFDWSSSCRDRTIVSITLVLTCFDFVDVDQEQHRAVWCFVNTRHEETNRVVDLQCAGAAWCCLRPLFLACPEGPWYHRHGTSGALGIRWRTGWRRPVPQCLLPHNSLNWGRLGGGVAAPQCGVARAQMWLPSAKGIRPRGL